MSNSHPNDVVDNYADNDAVVSTTESNTCSSKTLSRPSSRTNGHFMLEQRQQQQNTLLQSSLLSSNSTPMSSAAAVAGKCSGTSTATITAPPPPMDQPVMIQWIRRPKSYVNHSYLDYSRVGPVAPASESSDGGVVASSRNGNFQESKDAITDMNFVQKVHHMLCQCEYQHIIHWMDHGRAFRVEIPKRLESEVLPLYFNHRRYSSFLRQLSNHGFKNLTQGCDRNCHYHEVSTGEFVYTWSIS
jgi:HSF-type DNA-binding